MKNLLLILAILLSSHQLLSGNDFELFKDTPVYELAMAVKQNDVKKIEELIKSKKFDLEYKEKKYEQTILMVAVDHNKYKAVEALLKNGADPNARDYIDRTILMYQVGYGCDIKTTELLIKHGADVNAMCNFYRLYDPQNPGVPDGDGRTTPFIRACIGGCMAIIKCLVAHGADVNKWIGDEGNCALIAALIQDRMDVAKYLVIDLKVKIPPYWNIDKGDTETIFTLLRTNQYRLGSKDHRLKMEIVKYIKDNYNMDYFKEPLPTGFFLKIMKEDHPKDFEEYSKKY